MHGSKQASKHICSCLANSTLSLMKVDVRPLSYRSRFRKPVREALLAGLLALAPRFPAAPTWQHQSSLLPIPPNTISMNQPTEGSAPGCPRVRECRPDGEAKTALPGRLAETCLPQRIYFDRGQSERPSLGRNKCKETKPEAKTGRGRQAAPSGIAHRPLQRPRPSKSAAQCMRATSRLRVTAPVVESSLPPACA